MKGLKILLAIFTVSIFQAVLSEDNTLACPENSDSGLCDDSKPSETGSLVTVSTVVNTSLTSHGVVAEEEKNITVQIHNSRDTSSNKPDTLEVFINASSATEVPINVANVTDTNVHGSSLTAETSSETQTSATSQRTTEASSGTTEPPQPPPAPREISDDEMCTCDLTVSLCDINCCCDQLCSDADRKAFSTCSDTPITPDPRYCYQHWFVYHNNTPYQLHKTDKGLFCIVNDNLPKRHTFTNRQIVSSLSAFQRLHTTRQRFAWPVKNFKKPRFDPTILYKANEFVWTASNETFDPLALPVSVTSIFCQTTTPVRYLVDWSSSCAHIVNARNCELRKEFNANSYKEFNVVAALQLMNTSVAEACTEEACVTVTALLCPSFIGGSTNHSQCIESSNISSPVYNGSSCNNIVKKVTYLVHHNGSQGITGIEALFHLVNVTEEQIWQEFAVTFIWADASASLFKRSGSPGYIVGKPVLAGRKVLREEGEKHLEGIELSRDVSEWLSLATGDSSRVPVVFGQNMRASHMMQLTAAHLASQQACSDLQLQALRFLASDAIINVTETKMFNLYVATFGDSRLEDTDDWVQVLLENFPDSGSSFQGNDWSFICKNIVSSLYINILFANTGNVINPQAKIIGVAFKFGQPKDVVFRCTPLRCVDVDQNHVTALELVTMVTYIDTTKPAISQYADPPVYEVKLPHDFFYPFFYGSSSDSARYSVWFIFVSLLHTNFF